MTRTRSRRFCVQAFRRWAPWTVHLALAAVLNSAFDGPAWADEIGRWRALEASLVEAEQVPGPPSLDELVALLAPLMVEDETFSFLPDPLGSPLASPLVSRTEAVQPANLATRLSPFPTLAEEVGEGSTAALETAADSTPLIPPPPSLPGLPREESGRPVPSASAAAAAAASGDAIPLIPGWNLISLPKQPDSVDPATVLASISGSYQVVHAYDACSSDPWRTYDPANPAGSSLTAIDHRMGLWVRATAAATLAVSGIEPAETSIQLCQGWNLIGYPLSQPRPVLAALSSIAGKFQRVYGWDPADTADPWEVFDVTVPAWANDLEQMLPGRGYWIYATANTTLVMSNAGLPPEVKITSPANAAAVTAPTDVVGTVKSDLLERWTLAYRLKGETGVFTTFVTGNTPVANGVLGKFDPTLLLNGLYEIELTATDFQGQSVSTSIDVTVEGNLKIGHFTLSFVDLEVPLAGLPIQVIRTYDSRDKRLGDFGIGWRVSLSNVRLQEDGPAGDNWRGVRSSGLLPTYCVQPAQDHIVTVTLPDDQVLRFRPKLSPECQQLVPPQVVTLTYVPLPGTRARLTALDQSGEMLVVGSFPGSVQLWNLESIFIADPDRYRVTLQDGRALDVNQQGGLMSITDLNGNALNVGRNGITHSSGKGLAFQRDAQGRITRIVDPNGNPMTYAYDERGDLRSHSDQEENVSRYTYDVHHYLLSIEDPLGVRPVRSEYDDSGRLIRTTDALGRTIEVAHDLSARQEVVTDRLGRSRLYEYDSRGNIVREVDENGNVTLRTFDDQGRLTSLTDPAGGVTTNTYDASGNLLRTVDPLGNTRSWTYNDQRQVLTATDARGRTTTNAYDARGNLTSRTDAEGHVTKYIYDAKGNLLTKIDPVGNAVENRYNASGDVTEEVDAAGHATSYTYDGNGNRLTETTGRTTDAGTETLVTRFVYDRRGSLIRTVAPDGTAHRMSHSPTGKMSSSEDPLGRVTGYDYDAMGRLTRIRYPDGTQETFTYDAEGRTQTETGRAGRTTSYDYDAAGRPLRTTYPDGGNLTSTYDDAGRLITMTDARGNTTTYEYDAAGRRTAIRDPLGQEVAFTFDPNGNPLTVRDPAGRTVVHEYDGLNRWIRTTFSDGSTRSATYDTLGRQTSITDQAGRTTRFSYDPVGGLVEVEGAMGGKTRYAYDEAGNRIRQIDAGGRATIFAYDAQGREIRRTLPDGKFAAPTYDAAGNLVNHRDFAGRITTYEYDINDRLTVKRYPDGTAVRFTYLPTGRRATVEDHRGITAYSYDARDRLARITYPDGRRLDYEYDGEGNRTRLTASIGASVLTTTYTYDAGGRLVELTDPRGGIYAFTYDANGHRTSIEYPNGVRTAYSYDTLNRLKVLTTEHGVSGTTIQSYTYTLGPEGNRTRIAEQDGTMRAYEYDGLYRLIREVVTGGSDPPYEKAFTYDSVGNRLAQMQDGAAGTVEYLYDERDRLLQENGLVHTYDDNGNLISRPGGFTFAWGFENRLRRVKITGAAVIDYDYDVDGNLVEVVVTPASGPPVAVRYLVDPEEGQIVAESAADGGVLAYYVRGSDLLSVVRPTETRFVHSDGLGSIRTLTDEAGAVTDSYSYSAFGELLEQNGTDPQPYRFAGQLMDVHSGLSYHRARWMDPETGRFLSADPLDGLEFDPLTLHKYLYAAANPVNVIDPTGESFLSVTLVVVSIILILVSAYLNYQEGGFRAMVEGLLLDAILFAVGLALVRLLLLARGLLGAGRFARFLARWRTARLPRACFSGETPVATEEGDRPIREIAAGTRVWSRDVLTGALALKPVKQIFRAAVPLLIVLQAGGQEIRVTPDHPFWVEGEGWTRAGDLKPGDPLRTSQGVAVPLDSMAESDGPHTVYNMEVEGFHTFFVSDRQVLVHNKAMPLRPVGALKKPSASFLKNHGVDPHDVKQALNRGSESDIYIDQAQNVWVKLKNAPDDTAEFVGHLDDFLEGL